MSRHLQAAVPGPSPQAQHQLKLLLWAAEAAAAEGREELRMPKGLAAAQAEEGLTTSERSVRLTLPQLKRSRLAQTECLAPEDQAQAELSAGLAGIRISAQSSTVTAAEAAVLV